MRKSIYYLIANILSTIAAAIFIGVVNFQYPFFGTDLIVTGMSQNCWEPLKIVLLVVALSIIYVTRDVVVHKDGKQDTGLDKTIICCTCYQQEKSNYWFSINILKHFNRCWWCY